MSKLEFKSSLPSDAELAAMFDMVPKLERYQVGDKVTRAAGKIVLDRVKQLTPRSSVTGSSKKRSSKQRGGADWDNTPLWKGMAMAVRKYATSTWVWVGPRWREGQKIYFIAEWKKQTRRAFYWGRPGPIVRKLRNWIVQAFDETKSQQLSAMKSVLTTEIDRVMRGK